MDQEENDVALINGTGRRRLWPRLLFGLALSVLVLWLVARDVSLAEVAAATRDARPGAVALALLVICLTLLAKAWRWGLLYYPDSPPPFSALFWAMTAGQLVNLVSPLRLGEVARIYGLESSSPRMKTRSLGTIVVEKTLDSLMMALTVAILLPFVVVPAFVQAYIPTLLLFAALASLLLVAIAYQSARVVRLGRRLTGLLPAILGQRLDRLLLAGLQGLSALRSPRQTLALLLVSAGIAFLAILPPLLLFPAFALPFGLVEATLLNVVLSLGLIPPSTPAKLGIFEWLATLILAFVGLKEEALALSYALVFHAVVILPQLLFGTIAWFRLDWGLLPFGARRRQPAPSQPLEAVGHEQ